MSDYLALTYPATLQPGFVYVLRYGETPETVMTRFSQGFTYINPESEDTLNLTEINTSKAIVTTDSGLSVLRQVFGEHPFFQSLQVLPYPARTQARHPVMFCGDSPVSV